MSRAEISSTTLAAVVHRDTFDDYPVNVMFYRGRACWIARDVGSAIGYGHSGKRLVTQIRGEWSGEFVVGSDYDIIRDQDIHDLRDALRAQGVVMFPPNIRSIVVLYEPGIHLACLKTDKPAGKRLRRHLVEDVLPKLARGESVPAVQPTREPKRDRIEAAIMREQRLAAREHRLAMKMRSEAIMAAVEDARAAGDADENVLRAFAVKAREAAAGVDLTPLLPAAPTGDDNDPWVTPTDIGDLLGVTSQRVGRTIKTLGVRADKSRSMAVLNKSPHGNRTITTYIYHPSVTDDVRAQLVADGHLPADDGGAA